MQAPSASEGNFVTLARLLRPQGRHGELLADLHTRSLDLLIDPSGVLLIPRGADRPSSPERIQIQSHWLPTGRNAGRIVLKLTGVDSISQAEQLAGVALAIPAAERPALEDGTYYVTDLIGSTLYNGDHPVGEIVDVEFPTSADGRRLLEDAAPLLAVLPAGATEESTVLIPFVQVHLRAVEPELRRVVMQLPDGLLDLEESPGQ